MKKQTSKQKIAAFVLPLAALCALLIIAMLLYSDSLKKNLYADSVIKLGEISAQNVKVLNNQINGQLDSLTEVASRIAVPTNFDVDYTMYTLNRIMERYPFKKMSVIFSDGETFVSDGNIYQMSEEELKRVAPAFAGENLVSSPSRGAFDGSLIVSLMVPIIRGDEVNAILVASYETTTLQDMLNVSFFGGQGYSYITMSNGDIVADSTFPTSFKNTVNVVTSMLEANPKNQDAADKMLYDMSFNEDGYIIFNNKVDKYMYYSSVGINDWYLLSVIPASVIDSTRNSIMLHTYFLCGVICAIFALGIFFFVQSEKAKRHELQEILYIDPVTKGYTFQKFSKEAEDRLKNDPMAAALMTMDIEKFKIINEMFGYEEGNRVLRNIWTRLERWIKPGELYCRRNADKFTALVFYMNDDELIKRINDLFTDIMSDRTERRNGFVLRPVIGVYRITDRKMEIAAMQNNAAIALSTVKNSAKSRKIGFYDEAYKENILKNKILEDKMMTALSNKEFEVFYQPKYRASDKKLVGAEALVRWKNPDGTYTPPYMFVPIAEKNGFIVNIDKYVFRRVCDDQREWLDSGKELVPISVNLSRRHLYTPRFIDDYRGIVERSGIPIESIELEITESAMFENREEFIAIIDKLHEAGFRILMDDFGTGYSSLMMLKSIPIDVMKLDKSFVDDYNDIKGGKIISCVTQLAQSMDIEITAEGVETEDQYQFMRNLGCDAIQGYYFSKPIPKPEFEELLILNTCDILMEKE